MAEQLACEPLGPVADDGPTNLARCCDTETGMITIVSPDEDRHEAATDPDPGFVGSLEIRTASNVFCRLESGHDVQPRRRVGTACR